MGLCMKAGIEYYQNGLSANNANMTFELTQTFIIYVSSNYEIN